MLTQQAAQEWLESADAAGELLDLEQDQVRRLVGHEGFRHLLRLMLGARQTAYVQLASLQLSSPQNIALASDIQGRIKGIDLLRETVLELFATTQVVEGAKDQSNG